ncbi:hypothetical protein [Bradyrhizobium sp. USDA 313]|uniref:hypothetical protein n=1 Tax=Bradyrhizobium sp. USDA 313 TaxID=3156307 RepID=UPI0035181B94
MLKAIFFPAFLAVAVLSIPATANDVDGFRLGMSMQQASQLALEKGYKFSNPIKSGQNWTSYVLFKDGPNVSFCGNVLSSVGRSSDSNLHEFANSLAQWTASLGEPELEASQKYASGSPLSTIGYKWLGQDNVRRQISFWQYGSQSPQMSLSYGYIKHPCNEGAR